MTIIKSSTLSIKNQNVNKMELHKIFLSEYRRAVQLEKLSDIGRGIRKSTFLNSFPYPLIKTKLQDRCQQIGVLFVEQSCMYRSQRCSSCGFVLKKNRKGKTFKCFNCHMTMDADLNAARNHLVNLPPIFTKVSKESVLNGWFWSTI
jgi:transposase